MNEPTAPDQQTLWSVADLLSQHTVIGDLLTLSEGEPHVNAVRHAVDISGHFPEAEMGTLLSHLSMGVLERVAETLSVQAESNLEDALKQGILDGWTVLLPGMHESTTLVRRAGWDLAETQPPGGASVVRGGAVFSCGGARIVLPPASLSGDVVRAQHALAIRSPIIACIADVKHISLKRWRCRILDASCSSDILRYTVR